jgi:hypothetical protein
LLDTGYAANSPLRLADSSEDAGHPVAGGGPHHQQQITAVSTETPIGDSTGTLQHAGAGHGRRFANALAPCSTKESILVVEAFGVLT